MTALIAISLLFAVPPVVLYVFNHRLFRPPPVGNSVRFEISVLIPARNEERSIRACLDAVLANLDVEIECIVLDDGSTDGTASIVAEIAAANPRVFLAAAPPLPEGWSGKQHACLVLAKMATKPLLTFLDADVRLAPSALSRMATFQSTSGAGLVSGFPRQETLTILERLLIPLMHFILLGFLPIARMRSRCDPSLGAGCGQWFLTSRDAYDTMGGHEAVKASFHDGLTLPRAYRKAGLMTDICDATEIASCRMYRSAGEVWNGLAKNACEGLGTPRGIWFWSLLLGLGQILPFILAYIVLNDRMEAIAGLDYYYPQRRMSRTTIPECGIILAICIAILSVRLHSAYRFRLSYLGAILHPVSIALLIGIQWYATVLQWLGRPVGWKGPDASNSKGPP